MWPDLGQFGSRFTRIRDWEVLANLRAEGLDMTVVVATGDHDPETARRAAEARVGDVKAGSVDELLVGDRA